MVQKNNKVGTKRLLCTLLSAMILGIAGCGGQSANPADDSAKAGVELKNGSFTRYIYQGVEFGTGDQASVVVASLGNETRPSEQSQPCVEGAGMLTHYYFPGMIIEASEQDVILMINLTNDFDEGNDVTTIGGLKLGDSLDTAKQILGTPTEEDEDYLTYQDGSVQLTVMSRDGVIFSIKTEDTSIEF